MAARDTLTNTNVPDISAVHAFDAAQRKFQVFFPGALPILSSLDSLAFGARLWVFATGPGEWPQPVLIAPHTVALQEGLNLVAWLGPSGASLAEALAPLGDAVEIAFTFDAGAQAFGSFAPGRLEALNTNRPLRYGDGLWVKLSAPATWTQPEPEPSPPAVISADDGSATLSIPPAPCPMASASPTSF